MSDNVVTLETVTRLDIPAKRVLDEASNALDGGDVVVIGRDADGELYFASSVADGGATLMLIERAKMMLLGAD